MFAGKYYKEIQNSTSAKHQKTNSGLPMQTQAGQDRVELEVEYEDVEGLGQRQHQNQPENSEENPYYNLSSTVEGSRSGKAGTIAPQAVCDVINAADVDIKVQNKMIKGRVELDDEYEDVEGLSQRQYQNQPE